MWDLPRSPAEFAHARAAILQLRRGGSRAAFMEAIPKADGLTRTGHYLWPIERLYYQALVDSVLHSIDSKLGGQGNIFGYRAIRGRTSTSPFGNPLDQWKAFRQYVRAAARSGKYHAVAKTDIASFFERIQHQRLEVHLRGLGVQPQVATEIRQLLTRLMGDTMGLPQGSDPSSVLASAYLDPVDKYMLRKNYAYFRYVDDIYVFGADKSQARIALRELEARLRELALQLQPGKTEIVVGTADIKAKVIDADNDVASIAQVYRRAPRKTGLARVKKRWRSVSRRKPFPPRVGKYLLRRLAANQDPAALGWCVRNLGVLDWLTREVGPYLSLFASRAKVQGAILTHLASPRNNSTAEESSLLRVLLSARSVRRDVLDLARQILASRNGTLPSRQWAAILLGRHGDTSDHRLVVAHYADDEHLARAAVIAAQGMDAAIRGVIFTGVDTQFPAQRSLVRRVRGLAQPTWPTYQT